MRDPRYWLEQAAHFGLGAVAAAVVAIPLAALAGVVAALWLGGVREFDQRPVESWADMAINLGFTVAGGLAMGLAVWGVTR